MKPPARSVVARLVPATVLAASALVAGLLLLAMALPAPAFALGGNATVTPTTTPIVIRPPVVIEGYVSEAPDIRDRPGVLIPVPGAKIFFIMGNVVVANTVSNAVGYYSVLIPAGDYTVATMAPGFQTRIIQATFEDTQTHDIGLTPVPFNGFVPYALYPVLETSPGRIVECTMVVENFQVIDQLVTFTVVTPAEWVAWFPLGESMMVRTGDSNVFKFTLMYNGKAQGPHTMKVVVNGGAYFAEVPIICVVKDLPFERIDFYANSPEKHVKPGNTAEFILSVENKYAQGKNLDLRVDDKPGNWSATTGNGTAFFVPDAQKATTSFRVYVPSDTPPGHYTLNLTACGEGTRSEPLTLYVRVDGTPLYDAIVKSQNRSEDGYPLFNISTGEAFDIPVRVYNSWDFPVYIQASALIGDNWYYYFNGVPAGRLKIEPHRAQEFTLHSAVPNGTYGNFTARVYLEAPGQNMVVLARITVPAPPPPPPEPPKPKNDWQGPVLTGATAGVILISLGLSLLKKWGH